MNLVRIKDKVEIETLLEMHKDIFPHLHEKIEDIASYAEKLSKYAYVYEGKELEQPFGVVVFYANDKEKKTGYVSLIGVKREYQNRKLGKWLLEKCIEISKEQGMLFLQLEVDLDNHVAKNFYEKNGFVKIAVSERGSVYMERMI